MNKFQSYALLLTLVDWFTLGLPQSDWRVWWRRDGLAVRRCAERSAPLPGCPPGLLAPAPWALGRCPLRQVAVRCAGRA